MMQMTNKRTLLLGLAIIVLSNVIALGGVAYNRSGEPTSRPVLTERELSLPYNYGFAAENSGISLRLNWRVFDITKEILNYGHWTSAQWLDADKLGTLGFDVSYPLDKPDSHKHYQKALSREVFIVLENDGATYQKVLQKKRDKLLEAKRLLKQNPDKQEFKNRLKKTTNKLEAEQTDNSRLFVIDAGLDYESLRQQYSDNSQYLIARGEVNLRYYGNYNKKPYLRGSFQQLSVRKVNVPLEHASVITPLLDKNYRRSSSKHPPRYEVSLHYGQRYEPWIINVRGL